MPSAYAPIPLPGRSAAASRGLFQPVFSTPVRIALGVLSWLAFFVASYLAFHSVSGTSVAGCGMGESNGCDVVLTSSWSKLFGIPVAVLGLACYATLASLSVLLWLRGETIQRRVATAFLLFALVAMGASAWFIGVQVFAIGSYCIFCLTADVCGILIGVIALAATIRSVVANRGTASVSRGSQSGLMALRAATAGNRPSSASAGGGVSPAVSQAAVRTASPSLLIAAAGAIPLLLLLFVGQFFFGGKTYRVEQVALNNTINMNGGSDATAPQTHVTLRIPDDDKGDKNDDTTNVAKENTTGSPPDKNSTKNAKDTAASTTKPDAPPEPPAKSRRLKFLGGKLELDVYQHPIIGSPEAPHVLIEMMSYDCPHCRKMHSLMKEAVARYQGQVALLVMPIPMDKDCNKYVTSGEGSHPGGCATARLACGLARLDPYEFPKFHDFLMTGKEKPPAMERIIPKAYSMVDRDKLRQLKDGPEIKKQVDGYIELFGQLSVQSGNASKFGLPVTILGDKVLNGAVEKKEDLFKAWEENLGVTPK